METITSIVLFILLGICILGLLVCFGALCIIDLSECSKFFLKVYLYFFEHEDYKLYKEAKQIFKNGDKIPICSRFTKTSDMTGFYFIVHKEGISLWKDSDVVFVDFHKFILDELIKMGKLKEDIMHIREYDDYHEKKMHERIEQLEKEIAERKEKLGKLDIRTEELNAKDNA